MKLFISFIFLIQTICFAINVKQFTIPNNPLTVLSKIPCGSGSTSGSQYLTQAGDTCQSLGLIASLASNLNLTSICSNLPTGLPICIPNSVPYPSGPGSGSGSSSSVSCSSGTAQYTIKLGDTCYQLGLTWQQINVQNLNCILSNTEIF
jgi:hypothetical protein